MEETVSSFVQKADTQDNFVKLFLSNINFLVENLNSFDIKVLFYCIQKINYRNVFQYNYTEFVNYHVHKKIMSKASFYRSFARLKELKIFLPIEKQEHLDALNLYGKNYFLINPNLIGKGSLSVNEIKSNNRTETEFVIAEKNEDENIKNEVVYDKDDEIKLKKDYELAIMKEKNKEKELDNAKKELEIREKELENEKMKLEIKLNEQKKSKSERTLFDD